MHRISLSCTARAQWPRDLASPLGNGAFCRTLMNPSSRCFQMKVLTIRSNLTVCSSNLKWIPSLAAAPTLPNLNVLMQTARLRLHSSVSLSMLLQEATTVAPAACQEASALASKASPLLVRPSSTTSKSRVRIGPTLMGAWNISLDTALARLPRNRTSLSTGLGPEWSC